MINKISDNFSKDRSALKSIADESFKMLSHWSGFKEKINSENCNDATVKRFLTDAKTKASRLQLELMSLAVSLGDASCSEDPADLELLMKEEN